MLMNVLMQEMFVHIWQSVSTLMAHSFVIAMSQVTVQIETTVLVM